VLIPRAHERFDAEGRLPEPTTRQLLERFGAAMVAFVERCRPAWWNLRRARGVGSR
jgi:hypothetical protein